MNNGNDKPPSTPMNKSLNTSNNTNTELVFKPLSWEIQSETDKDKKYLITNYRPNIWNCSCNSFRYNCHDKEGYRIPGKFCKHILKIKQKTGRP